MLKLIGRELGAHVPFTLFGALTGVVLMLVIIITRVTPHALEPFFKSFHSLHVLLSAIVTSAMYRRYRGGIVACVLIGYVGSVGVGTLSDIVFPYLGGMLLGAEMHLHVAFIENWWLINPVALVGVAFGAWRVTTKIPHSGHVLLSTWASLFYLTAHSTGPWQLSAVPLAFAVLFVAVWVPCCFSDIAFPLLFVRAEASETAHHAHD